MSVSCY